MNNPNQETDIREIADLFQMLPPEKAKIAKRKIKRLLAEQTHEKLDLEKLDGGNEIRKIL